MKRLLSVLLAAVMIAGLLCTGALAEDSHKREPEAPGAAVSDADSDKAAIRVRVNGSWYGTYVQDYKGQNGVWVPVYLDLSKLKTNGENSFHFSSNVLSYGNYTDSSLDLFSSWTKENLNSLFTQDPACDGNWRSYSDRNVNVRLELYNGSEWVAAAPQETTYYDEHTVLGQFANNGNWYNAGRILTLGNLDGYTAARMMVQLHVGSKLDVIEGYAESDFAVFLTEPGTDDPGTDKPGTDDPGTGKPGADKPGTDKPGTDKPGTDKPATDSPKTGDRFSPMATLLLAFTAAGLCTLLGLTVAKKRKETE